MNTRHTKDPALDPAAHASTARENPVQTPTATITAISTTQVPTVKNAILIVRAS